MTEEQNIRDNEPEKKPKRLLSEQHRDFAEKRPVPYMVVVLLVLTVLVAFLLGLVNQNTAPVIARLKAEALAASVGEVLLGVQATETLEGYAWEAPVQAVHRGLDAEGSLLGYAVESAPTGFSGAITLMVGVAPDGSILGVKVVELSESAGIGTKVQEDSFLSQFTGQGPGFTFGKGTENVHAITGATVSSTAVASGVSAAVAAVLEIEQGGAAQ